MNEKKIILSIGPNKPIKAGVANWDKLIEEYAPGLYESHHAGGEKESLSAVKKLQPDIIYMGNTFKNSADMIRKIKELSPKTAILVAFSQRNFPENIEEEIDLFISCGAYKCYYPPLVMDTFIHDCFVALNLE